MSRRFLVVDRPLPGRTGSGNEERVKNAEMASILFEPDHAREVLRLFGVAHKKLPRHPRDLNNEQEAFLDQSIEELSNDGRIICVQLALFAEMFKGKPWNRQELQRLGGI